MGSQGVMEQERWSQMETPIGHHAPMGGGGMTTGEEAEVDGEAVIEGEVVGGEDRTPGHTPVVGAEDIPDGESLPPNRWMRRSQAESEEPEGGQRCYNCGSSGHIRRECPHNECWNCGRRGHDQRVCTRPRVYHARRPESMHRPIPAFTVDTLSDQTRAMYFSEWWGRWKNWKGRYNDMKPQRRSGQPRRKI